MALDRAEIAAQLRSDISQGLYKVGERLPSQRELATRLGGAPNTVGEALKILAGEGLVRIRDRSGAVVQELAGEPAEPVDPTVEARDVLQHLQTDLRQARSTLAALDQRITDSLERLDRPG